MYEMHELGPSRAETLRHILEAEELVTSDLSSSGAHFFGFSDRTGLRGVAGLEIHGSHALLRSMVTLPAARGQGLGRQMVDALVAEAARRGCADVWLLTIDSDPFFEKVGFAKVPREAAPATIRSTEQWSSLCPGSAHAMHRGAK